MFCSSLRTRKGEIARHCEERSYEANQKLIVNVWVASLTLAMTCYVINAFQKKSNTSTV
ncbi:MAG: hypothetical protein LBH30_06045 [Prevotellaceae bacterium]|nr:hypothetical protein [Prevotellaceae bacterium]